MRSMVLTAKRMDRITKWVVFTVNNIHGATAILFFPCSITEHKNASYLLELKTSINKTIKTNFLTFRIKKIKFFIIWILKSNRILFEKLSQHIIQIKFSKENPFQLSLNDCSFPIQNLLKKNTTFCQFPLFHLLIFIFINFISLYFLSGVSRVRNLGRIEK